MQDIKIYDVLHGVRPLITMKPTSMCLNLARAFLLYVFSFAVRSSGKALFSHINLYYSVLEERNFKSLL
jgi:hypothetical protein